MLISAWMFSRWMALIYLAAFWSLGVQVLGLIGSHGIMPVPDFLHLADQALGARRYWAFPTLCWLNNSDGFLMFLCWAGAVCSILLLFGVCPGVNAFCAWLLYLSLTVAGQDFLGFQWDNLLLESGFLLIFLFPKPLGLHVQARVRPSVVVIWLLRWLLFRLMFESGMVKLLSRDPAWANLTALTYHYWTQPLPNPISWYANQLPLWFQKLSCGVMFATELCVPFLIFFGRWARLAAFAAITGLQLLIMVTVNYCFFNFLALGLCLTLLEDEHWIAVTQWVKPVEAKLISGGMVYKVLTCVLAVFVLIVSAGLMVDGLVRWPMFKPVKRLITWVSGARSVNNYGLFAMMTTERNEIILEGSDDGEHWRPYEFPYKPGDLQRPPPFVAPYQPRLDWQMWFAALGTWRENTWVMSLMQKLLQGEPSVERLMAVNPFPDHPPKYIQATFWGYQFTDFKTKGSNGAWWRRDIRGLYCPTMSLN